MRLFQSLALAALGQELIDTDDHAVMAGIVIALITVLMVILIVFNSMRSDSRLAAEEARILREGIAARARVKDIRPTSSQYEGDPEVALTLDVMADEPFEVVFKTTLSPVYIPRFQPGAILDVRFDRLDRNKIVVTKP